MNKYIAIAATKNKIIENWGGTSEFTNDCINQLAKSALNKPILLDFDKNEIIGKVVSATNIEGRLCIEFELKKQNIINFKHRLVPQYRVDLDEWNEEVNNLHRIIKNAESISYGLTLNPAEKGLPEIEKID